MCKSDCMVMYEFWEPGSEMPMKLEEVFFFFETDIGHRQNAEERE